MVGADSAPLLLTGAAGFIGARFAHLRRARLRLVSVDVEAQFDARVEHAEIDFGTIVDRDVLFDWLGAERRQLSGILHLGACTDTTENDLDYLERVNVDYSRKLWAYAAEHGIPFVYASSAAVYGDGSAGYDDDAERTPLLHPLNPYGDSKLRFDLWALEEARRGHAPPRWAGLRFFNVYGPGEAHKGRMASVALQAFRQLREHGEVNLFRSHRADVADGDQRRDFVYVDDVVSALEWALAEQRARGILNLGTGKARSFLDLAHAVSDALGVERHIRFVDTPEDLRARYQYFTEACVERLRATGYTRPFASLEEGVGRYVAWLREREPIEK